VFEAELKYCLEKLGFYHLDTSAFPYCSN